jgi:hypothetical protein
MPLPEMELRSKPKFKLEEGRAYLITKEKPSLRDRGLFIERYLTAKDKPSHGLTIFMDQVNHGVPGLWITSLHPKQVGRCRLKRTPVVYLTTEQIKGEVALSPRKLDKGRAFVSNYLLQVRGRSVVLIDSLEKLVAVNGFERTIEFLKEMAGLCSKNNSNLIVQVDSSKLKKGQLEAVEKVIPPL